MGGYGSGRWGGKGRHCTVEECDQLDVRNDALKLQLSQHKGSEVKLTIAIPHTTPYKQDNYDYWFTSTACGYGGVRWWISCPVCARRCAVLYRPSYRHGFACRQCHHLTYTSAQAAHKWDRSRLGTVAAEWHFEQRYQLLMSKWAHTQRGSKAWRRIEARLQKLTPKRSANLIASRARSAALEVKMKAVFARYAD